MSENIEFSKQVFNKKQYEKVIDTSFKQLGVESVEEILQQQPTVTEFFQLYNELFYNINELGENNSHEFLIKKSSEYIKFEEKNEIIEALQNEIAQLRTELLDTQKQLIESQTEMSLDENNSSITTPITTSPTVSPTAGSNSGGNSSSGY
tara:strand:- start:4316 stop:4765 length:450 start_codon:yes stop_codon:yes gene_type:complete